ncbi:extracellular solute-binding protein [Humitalea sp. 24SJ18S-53]|uniref:extracellular solute-binding protein n=1 Tax=Humitalea sp. 24SJ18S-53 TaxID=3422307 RepID=UPI003D67B5E0
MLRRRQLMSLIPGGVLPGVLLPAITAQAQPGRDLVIATTGGAWQDALREALFRPFQATTGVRVLEETREGGIAELRARANGGGWDVVLVEGDELLIGVAEGLFSPLNWTAIANPDTLAPDAVHPYGLGAARRALVLGYDPAALTGVPEGWADLFDLTRFPGPRALRRGPRCTLEVALLADGVAPEALYATLGTEEGVVRAFRLLTLIRRDVRWWDTSSLPGQWLARGEVGMAAAFNGRITAAGRAANKPLGIAWDKALTTLYSWVLPATRASGGNQDDRPLAFLRLAAEAGPQAALATRIPFTPTAIGAPALMTPAALAELPSAHADTSLSLNEAFWAANEGRLERRFDLWLADT